MTFINNNNNNNNVGLCGVVYFLLIKCLIYVIQLLVSTMVMGPDQQDFGECFECDICVVCM